MIRLTLAQMRRSVGRLTAAGIAIALGAAFVAATLIAGNVIQRGTYDSVAASLGEADLVVDVYYGDAMLDEATIDEIADVEGVETVAPLLMTYQELQLGDASTYVYVVSATGDPRLESQTVTAGSMPDAPGEIALPAATAKQLGASVGDVLDVPITYFEGVERVSADLTKTVEVVGLLDDPYNAYASQGGAAIAAPAELISWAYDPASPDGVDASSMRATVIVADDASVAVAQDAIRQIVDEREIKADVSTKDEHAKMLAGKLTGGENVLTTMVLAFAGLALLVAGLVISNTFQVLVAQRARTLALLRCVGANKRQLRTSVLVEASLLGLSASVVGLVAGAAIAQVALSVIGGTAVEIPLPEWIIITPSVVILPLLAGLLVTIGAALAPARAATRVSPLAALRPLEAPTLHSKAGRVRLTIATLMVLGGAALMAGGIVLSRDGEAELGLIAAFAGGAISVVGLLISTPFWIPRVTAVVGGLLNRFGPTSRLAAANSLRNPRRTAATSTALLIGVTLVVTMSTGAASARVVLLTELEEYYPIDVSVSDAANFSWEENGGAATGSGLDPRLLDDLAMVEGVGDVAPVTMGVVWDTQEQVTTTAVGVDPGAALGTLPNPDLLGGLDEDTVLMTEGAMETEGIAEGDTLTFAAPSGSESAADGGAELTLTVHASPVARQGYVMTTANLERVAAATALDGAWIGLDGTTTELDSTVAIKDVFAQSSAWVSGSAVERASLEDIIDTMLAIVVGLLAVAVVIALIGVANTLSLSVLERQRESATLRAIGLTKKQLRSSLAIEGLLITLVGAVLGITLGLVYGWTGAAAALGMIGDAPLVVPWRDVGLVVVVAVVAGLLASVLPARRAARTSPVAALGAE